MMMIIMLHDINLNNNGGGDGDDSDHARTILMMNTLYDTVVMRMLVLRWYG